MRKKPPAGVKIDVFRKLLEIPSTIDLGIATALAGYALAALFFEQSKFMGFMSLMGAGIFAGLGINSVMAEMKRMRWLQSCTSIDAIRRMKDREFRDLVAACYSAEGFSVTDAGPEVDPRADADLIARRGRTKDLLLIQTNHFNEPFIELGALQSLYRAGEEIDASGVVVITLGTLQHKAAEWAAIKGVAVVEQKELMAKIRNGAGLGDGDLEAVTEEDALAEPPAQEPEQTAAAPATHRISPILFVDFRGICSGLEALSLVLQAKPDYAVVATSMPEEGSVEDLQDVIGREIHKVESTAWSQPHVDIMKYLSKQQPFGRLTPWLALDTRPRAFPEGTIELVVVSPEMGVNKGAVSRLENAMDELSRRVERMNLAPA